MSASFTRSDRVLSVGERERMRRDINDRERVLQGHLVVPHVKGAGSEGMSERRQGRWEGFIDRSITEDSAMIRRQIQHLKRNLQRGMPRNLSTREKKELEKQVAEDREYLQRNMVPSRVYQQPSVFHRNGNIVTNPAFEKSKKAVMEGEVGNLEFQRRANRFKNNMRELDPENPDASNIEKLRPKK